MKNIFRLAIDIGHNVSFDGGAVGIKAENVLNYQVGSKLIERCRASGVNVVNCTPTTAISLNDSLNKRVIAANTNNADFFISIHHNLSPGGEGSEIYCINGGRGEAVANIILPEIVKLGFKNRGVKDGSHLYVINRTKMPAILIECAFCDSPKDMGNYDTVKMAEAIFTGICKAFKFQAPINDTSAVYHIVVKGDTLWGLSRRYGVTLNSIIALNGVSVASVIVIGDKPDSLIEASEITRHLIEEILKWNDEDIKKKLNNKTFRDQFLGGMLDIVFCGSTFNTISAAYPNKFKEWELKSTTNGFWTIETGIKATKWLIEEKLKWSSEDLSNKIVTVNRYLFTENGLLGMLHIVFEGSPILAIESAYPGKFKPWQFSKVPRNYWNKDNIKQACDWLFEEKLHWNRDDIKNKIKIDIFIENGLLGFLKTPYNNSCYLLLKDIYPDEDWSVLKSKFNQNYQ